MRRCIGCGISKPKSELVRIAKGTDGPEADLTGNMDGRGVYLCRGSESCFRKAVKKKALERAFQRGLSEEQIKKLWEDLAIDEK